jgi:general stress protein 26
MSENDPRQIVWKHIQSIGICMMVTAGDEHLRARPMRGIFKPEDNAIWFFTDAGSNKDAEIAERPDACLTFIDTRDQNFVSVSGTVARVNDREQLAELWNEGAEAYFPKGKDDPTLALLKFTPARGEYWDAPSNPIVLAIKFLQAKLTSERPDLGLHDATPLS